MSDMPDEEFIDFYKDAYGALDMPDDEVIERRRELQAAAERCRDKPNLVSKSVLAEMLGTSLKTVDDWIRKGAPVYQKGNHGVAYQIDTSAFFDWYFARAEGISMVEFRERKIKEGIEAREHDEARWRLIEAEHRNRKLAATIENLKAELAALRREVQSLKRADK